MNLYFMPVIAFVVATICTPILMPLLVRLKFGQVIRKIGPSWHNKKSGTPTMGGIAIIIAVLAAFLTSRYAVDHNALLALLCALGFGAIGFADDFIKVVLKRNLGLLAWQKSALQLAVSVVFVFVGLHSGVLSTAVYIPFAGYFIDFSWGYIPFAIFVMLAATNGVNLTDGVDGLASSVTIFVLLFFGFTAYSHPNDLSFFCYTIIGALAGFLIYNKYPARIFMGDTGSLFLGGAVAAVALLQQNPLILLLVGIIYVIETLSVIIQVISFKATGRRIFKMSPIHHHFELCGWSEKKIVAIFSIVTIIAAFTSYLLG